VASAVALAKAEAALRREGKGIHFAEIENFFHGVDALPSRFALAGHDNLWVGSRGTLFSVLSAKMRDSSGSRRFLALTLR